MRRLRPSSEAEMVALFLRTELPAARFRQAGLVQQRLELVPLLPTSAIPPRTRHASSS
jgi:hypothetical protein